MSEILVSPAEPPFFRSKGTTSPLTEKMGVDFLWSMGGVDLGGAQRKELRDLVASLNDGRLSKELAQMEVLGFRGLVIEGRGKWTRDGVLVDSYTKFTKKALTGVVLSIQHKGVRVWWSDGKDETWQAIEWMRAWSLKDEHNGLVGREPVRKTKWGRASNRDYAVHVLTSLPGVGVKTAEAILDHFGWLPLVMGVSEEQLLEVPGVGKVMARRMMEVFE